MGSKNSRLIVLIETSLKEVLKKEAKENGISLGHLCRQKIVDSPRLAKIEFILGQINKKVSGGIKNGKNKSNR